MATPEQQSVDDLLGELQAEFGKPKKSSDRNAAVKALNRAFHDANPPLAKGAASYAKAALEGAAFRNYYDWERHRVMLLEEKRQEQQRPDMPDLEWYPDARVTYIITQRCGCCANVVQFVGSEYVRFRGKRRVFHELGGTTHEMVPTVLQRADKVDPNLLAFGLPNGDPLPDFVEELEETVRRCVGCIRLETAALDLWVLATQPRVQDELPGFAEAMNEGGV